MSNELVLIPLLIVDKIHNYIELMKQKEAILRLQRESESRWRQMYNVIYQPPVQPEIYYYTNNKYYSNKSNYNYNDYLRSNLISLQNNHKNPYNYYPI
jgi:hypothetical protein